MANNADAIDLMNQNTRLKAEMERLKARVNGLGAATSRWKEECGKAERERDEAREVLGRFLAYKPFEQKFNHSGAMNATQLAERDKYVEIRDMAVDALTGRRE